LGDARNDGVHASARSCVLLGLLADAPL